MQLEDWIKTLKAGDKIIIAPVRPSKHQRWDGQHRSAIIESVKDNRIWIDGESYNGVSGICHRITQYGFAGIYPSVEYLEEVDKQWQT